MKYLIILLFSFPAFAMQHQLNFYAAQSGINYELIQATKAENPMQLLTTLTKYYKEQSPDKKSWLACITNPYVNAHKIAPYIKLCMAINKEVNQPILGTRDEEEIDHDALDARAHERFNQKWPLISIGFDLQDQEQRLLNAYACAKQLKKQLPRGTQDRLNMSKVLIATEQHIDSIKRARTTIDKKDLIQEMHTHPLKFILTNAGHLEQILCEINAPMFIQDLDTQFKINHREGNSLLHELCLSSLTEDQFKEVLNGLTEFGIHINVHNDADQTPLDYAMSNNANAEFISILQSLGAEHALPKKESLKTSSDSSSPQGSPTPQKKKLRISLIGRLPIK